MKALYTHTEDVHNMTAPREVVPIIMSMVNPKSVLDVGCGTGTWLRAFVEAGVSDYIGVDGNYVERSKLNIPLDRFIARDLRTAYTLNRKYDLVISLEVAEHLPETSAGAFVETLVSHADNVIIFSAAIPGQGGQNHLNEQWPEYWQQKFLKYGFYFHDVIRPLIRDNENVEWWYRQNIFLITNQKNHSLASLSLVRPELFEQNMRIEKLYRESLIKGEQGLRISAIIFFNSIKSELKKIFG